jgi:nucleoside-diphosphate-sugar epimerase
VSEVNKALVRRLYEEVENQGKLELLDELVDPHAKVEVLAESRSGIRWGHTPPLDLHRAREDLGYKPRFDIAQGVADAVQELGLTAPV